jgi:hypothetical protein
MPFIPLFLFSIGVMLATTICTLWGKFGGDEKFEISHPELRKLIHLLHHWMFGLALVSICPLFMLLSTIRIPVFFILGLGLGLFIDDVIFHNCECYFQRKTVE